jgi:hypothetical protein
MNVIDTRSGATAVTHSDGKIPGNIFLGIPPVKFPGIFPTPEISQEYNKFLNIDHRFQFSIKLMAVNYPN